MATSTACIFGSKHDIHDLASALRSARAFLHCLCHELWSINALKLDWKIYPPSVNSVFYFTARLANSIEPNFAKRWTVNCTNNLP